MPGNAAVLKWVPRLRTEFTTAELGQSRLRKVNYGWLQLITVIILILMYVTDVVMYAISTKLHDNSSDNHTVTYPENKDYYCTVMSVTHA